MSTVEPLQPQDIDWGFFTCGDRRIDARLRREAALVPDGLQFLSGVRQGGRVVAALTLRAGQLQAPPEDVAQVAGRTGVRVPTLHIEVLAVDIRAQRQGYATRLINSAVFTADDQRRVMGLHTVSLEATAESVPFYLQVGFQASPHVYPDGSRAMWLVL